MLYYCSGMFLLKFNKEERTCSKKVFIGRKRNSNNHSNGDISHCTVLMNQAVL